MPHHPSQPTERTSRDTIKVRGAASGNLRVLRGIGALSLGLLMTACAGMAGRAGTTPAPVAGDEPPLESVRASLTAPEDSLVLDLVLGYRARTQGSADAETYRRARSAQTQLEYMLRHGGIKNRGAEARVIAIDGERLTLEETVNQLSAALLRHTTGTAWRPQAERAREIQRRRPELSALVEDADWVLALTAALESPLPTDTKAHLRRLHESYAARAPHAEIARQVNALLPAITDESLQRELKKLANRSWDRERRGPAAPSAPTAPTVPSSPAVPASPPPVPAAPSLPNPESSVPASWSEPDSGAADSTAADVLAVTPERFCAERRADAAVAFAQARATADPAVRAQRLQQSLELLDACIARFPDSPEAAKARQNRTRVEQELKP